MDFANSISLASLYFALVGLLGSFFFIHLGQWVNEVLANKAAWEILKNQGLYSLETYDKRLACFQEATRQSSSWTRYIWRVITAFLGIACLFLLLLILQVGTSLLVYVGLPCAIFMAIYLTISIKIIRIGYKAADSVKLESKSTF